MPFTEIIWKTLVEAYREASTLIVINLLWVFFTAIIITAPPAAAGMYYATNLIAHKRGSSWRDFFIGFRRYFWLSWRWALLNVGVLVILLGSYLFYLRFDTTWSTFAQVAVVTILMIWIALLTYTFPLLIEQTDRRLQIAIRNSFVLYLRQPAICFGTLTVLLILAGLSLLLRGAPWVFFSASLSAFIANSSVVAMFEQLDVDMS